MTDASPTTGWLSRPATWAAVAGLVVLLFIAKALLGPREAPLPAYFEIPAFSLTSQAGEPFGTGQLAGSAWVAGFFFTRCPTVCPILVQRQAEVQRRTQDLGPALRFVTISIDPGNDTPEAMTAYGEARKIPWDRWTFLTGETAAIQQLVRDGFKEYLKSEPGMSPEEIVHSVRFFLVDQKGRVRGLYDGTQDAELERLVHDATRIVRNPDEEPAG